MIFFKTKKDFCFICFVFVQNVYGSLPVTCVSLGIPISFLLIKLTPFLSCVIERQRSPVNDERLNLSIFNGLIFQNK